MTRPVIARPNQPLMGHLQRVSLLAESKITQNAPAAAAAGMLHDLGKASGAWQDYIHSGGRDSGIKSPGHSMQGAVAIAKRYGTVGHLLAHVIAGHHGGMPNTIDLITSLNASYPELPDDYAAIVDKKLPEVPQTIPVRQAGKSALMDAALWGRMILSALVDADWSDSAGWSAIPPTSSWLQLCKSLDKHTSRIPSLGDPAILATRQRLYQSARQGVSGHGCYLLSAPTGSGKTLAGLRLAAQTCADGHARRVIVAIPFTSITEQTAAVYRPILADAGLTMLEHHSTTDERVDRMAESWSDDVIVTTNVQLLESLYTNRPAKARKLHNIANSIILLDEPQSVPVGMLSPVIESLDALAKLYRCVIVLTTATPPQWPIDAKDITPDGLVMPDRVSVDIWPNVTSDLALTDFLKRQRQAMVIVNSRKTARRLWSQVPHAIHLSTWMCPAHRQSVLAEVRERLRTGQPCILIATQVVEAGVDISFPVVVRAWAGLGSITQAAGRCNRHGEIDCGRLIICDVEGQPQRGEIATQIARAKEVVATSGLSPIDPDAVGQYYRLMTVGVGHDKAGIAGMHGAASGHVTVRYADIAVAMRLIDDTGVPVLTPFGGGQLWIDRINNGETLTLQEIREMSKFVASAYENDVRNLAGYDPNLDIWVLPSLHYDDAGIDVTANPKRIV